MRIAGVMVARNEEDILEASVRHNLRVLDAITVVDHASTDATPAILASLAAEGLPIEVLRDDSLGFDQSKVTTGQVRRILASGADLCIPIDADEFLRIPSRETFERTVAAADPAIPLAMPWLTYLPDFDAPGDIVAKLRRARRKPTETHNLYKVIVRRSFVDTPGATVGVGNHNVIPADASADNPHMMVPASLAAMAHVPVRSVGQYVAKIATGHLSRLLANPNETVDGFHLRNEYASILAGRPPTRERLAEIVANCSAPKGLEVDPAQIAWIEDPFLADIALKYTPAREPSPLAAVLAFGERVAAEVARTTGGV